MEIYISDTQYPVMVDSLDVEDGIDTRSTASFTVKDLNNEYDFQKGQQVRIENNGNLIFRGFVETSEKKAITHTNNYVHLIDCIDMHYLADKRVVILAEENTTAGSVVETIVSNYLESEGGVNTLKYWDDYGTQTWNEVIS